MGLNTRDVLATWYLPNGELATDEPIVYHLVPGSYQADSMIPTGRIEDTTNNLGQTATKLWVNAEGMTPTRWIVTMPSGEQRDFLIPPGTTPITLQTLLELKETYPIGLPDADYEHDELLKGQIFAALADAADDSLGDGMIGYRAASAGAYGRTVHDRFRSMGVIEVADYGAIGDGASHPLSDRFATLAEAQAVYPHATALTDELDGVVIQAAINASTGQPVCLENGRRYLVNVGLSVPPAVRETFALIGAGVLRTIVIYSGQGAFLTLDPTPAPLGATSRFNWHIEGFYLGGPGLAVAGVIGLGINNAALGRLVDVSIADFETGIKMDAYDSLNSCRCFYNKFYDVIVNACGTGLHVVRGAHANEFFGLRVSGCTTGIRLAEATDGLTFHGGAIESCTSKGAVLDGYGSKFLGTRFENNTICQIHLNEIGVMDSAHGTKHVIMPYLQNSNIDTAAVIRDDSLNADNMIIWPGYLKIGDSNTSPNLQVIKASRTVTANAEPFVDIADTASTSGSPIGYRYRFNRVGTVPIRAERNDPTPVTGGIFSVFEVQTNIGGSKAGIALGAYNSVALDTNLYRDSAGILKTDGGFRAAGAILTTVAPTFTVDDATPSVAAANVFMCPAYTVPITSFTGGTIGQTIKIRALAAVTINHSANLRLAGGVPYVMTAQDTITLTMYSSGTWVEDCRSINT